MVAAFEVVELVAGGGFHPSRAIQLMRHLFDAGLVRRGPRGRPGSNRLKLALGELADVVLSLPAQLPINGPNKARRTAAYVAEPGAVVDALFALPQTDSTLRSWLIAVLGRLAALPRDQRKALYLDKVVPTLTFCDELTSPYPYADVARFTWGNQYIDFRPIDGPMRDVLEEQRPKLRPYYTVLIEIGLLLDLTPPPAAAPEREEAAALPGAAASPDPADAEQTLATATAQPGPNNPKVSVDASAGNRLVESAGDLLIKDRPHATRHRRRTSTPR
jgi:hypothetical protein